MSSAGARCPTLSPSPECARTLSRRALAPCSSITRSIHDTHCSPRAVEVRLAPRLFFVGEPRSCVRRRSGPWAGLKAVCISIAVVGARPPLLPPPAGPRRLKVRALGQLSASDGSTPRFATRGGSCQRGARRGDNDDGAPLPCLIHVVRVLPPPLSHVFGVTECRRD